MNNEVAYEITKLVVEFEQKMTQFAEEQGLEINRLMLIITDDIVEDIKRGKFELIKHMTSEEIANSMERLKEVDIGECKNI